MATFDSGRQRYSMNFYRSHQRPLQRRSDTGRPSRPAEGQLRVNALRPLRALSSLGGFRTPALTVRGTVNHWAGIRNPAQKAT